MSRSASADPQTPSTQISGSVRDFKEFHIKKEKRVSAKLEASIPSPCGWKEFSPPPQKMKVTHFNKQLGFFLA